jgi:threonine/homoserine/homoserine lactone efflux protein
MSQAWAILAAPETTQDPQWTALIAIVCALLLGATVLFFALEIPGLRRDKGPLTLSWSIRRWLGIYPKDAKRARWAVPVFVVLELLAIGFLVWFGWHILTQGPAEAHFYRLER